jgi:RimJ/RimL family protein N-acetyltransferase
MKVVLRRATAEDIQFVWDCRQELVTGIGRSATAPETFEGHTAWMTRALSTPTRLFAIAVDRTAAQTRLGYVRADPAGHDTPAWMASLCLHSTARGRGLAQPVLRAGVALAAKAGLMPLLADIHITNLASLKVFAACGFAPLPADCPHAAGLHSGFDRFIYIPVEGTHHGH